MTDQILLADIGGTNARFALMEHGDIGPPEHLRVADFPRIEDAMAAFLSRQGGTKPAVGVLGVAGPVVNNVCIFTNSTWVVDGDALAKQFGIASVTLLNDFEALGWSLPALKPADLFALGDQRPAPEAPMLVLGPGTGFGTAAFLQAPLPAVVVTEAGHATLPATSDREAEVIAELRRNGLQPAAPMRNDGAGGNGLSTYLRDPDGNRVEIHVYEPSGKSAGKGSDTVTGVREPL